VQQIGELEHYLVSNVGHIVPEPVKTGYTNVRDVVKSLWPRKREEVEGDEWGVKKAQEANQTEASTYRTTKPLLHRQGQSVMYQLGESERRRERNLEFS
jgi:bifunctional DNA-binding transcriptional regulator/antitoxin component of YhaV-PrlF toxin-antitoxin module